MSENISGLTAEQVEARLADIPAEFTALELSGESSDDDIAKGEALAAEMAELRTRLADIADRQSRLDALAESLNPKDEDEDEIVDEEDIADEPLIPDEIVDEDDEEDEDDGSLKDAVEVPEPAIAASVPKPKPSPAKRAAAHTPEVKMPKASSTVITAAADVPNYASGHRFDDLDGAVDAVVSRLRALPTHSIPNTRLRYGALQFQMEGFGDLVQGAGMEDQKLVQKAGDEKRLSGGTLALTADAWCAPSETLYDFCSVETVSGILSVPEFKVTRGGIRYTTGPSMADVADCSFHVDSDGVITDESGTVVVEKPCCDVPCPDFDEIRLQADGICIRGDILANVGYPEVTRRYIELAMIAHSKRMNKSNIDTIVAAAGAPIAVPDNSTLLFNLDYLEWYAVNMRSALGLSLTAGIEIVIPDWIKPLLRAEVGRRTGYDNVNTPDSVLRSYFSTRNLTVQYVRDYQTLTGYPGAIAVPGTVQVVMYPSGSWTRGTQGVISLDTLYDSTNLKINKYTALFTEEASLLVQKCLGTIALDIPISVSGLTGAQITAELGTAAPVVP